MGPSGQARGRPDLYVYPTLSCAGLTRASHLLGQQMAGGWVYIVTDKPYGTLYIGVTGDIARRAWEHREGMVEGFTKQYSLKRLVYAEHHDDIRLALQREKTMKHWKRVWKIDLIQSLNPEWSDLYETLI